MHTPIGCYPGSEHRLESQLTPKLLQHRVSDTHGTHTHVRHGSGGRGYDFSTVTKVTK